MKTKPSNSTYLNHLDQVLHFVDHPTEVAQSPTFVRRIASTAYEIFRYLARVYNYRWGDGLWHDNISARKVVKYYIWKAKPEERNPELTRKILAIYDKLAPKDLYREWIENPPLSYLEPTLEEVDPHSSGRATKIDNSLLFHIQAGEFGANSVLEGHQSEAMMKYMIEYLEERKIDPRIVEEIKGALALYQSDSFADGTKPYKRESFIAFAKQQFQEALNKQKPMLVCGGWIGLPNGHTMYYHLIPQGDRITFRLYNLGGGAQNQDPAIKGNKVDASPYWDWKGIKPEKFQQDKIWKIIHELQTQCFVPGKGFERTNYSEKDVYNALKEVLEPVEECCGQDIEMAMQEVGICSLRSLMAYLRTEIPEDEYKRLRLHLQLQSLVSKVRQLEIKPFVRVKSLDKKKLEGTAAECRLVEKSFRNVAISVERLYREKIIDDTFLAQAHTQLKEVYRSVKKARAQHIVPTKSHVDWKHAKLGRTVPKEKLPKISKTLHQQLDKPVESQGAQPYHFIPEQMKTVVVNSPSALQQLRELGEKGCKEHQYTAVQMGLIDQIRTWPLDPGFWRSACTTDTAEQMILDLSKVGQLLFTTSFMVADSAHISPERIYALTKIQAVQHFLLSIVDYSLVESDVKPNIEQLFHRLDSTEPFFRVPDAHINRELNSFIPSMGIGIQFNASSKYENRAQFGHCFTIPFWGGDAASFVAGCPDGINTELIKILLKGHPDLEQRVAREHGWWKWNQMKITEQAAHIYCSQYLPEWFKNIRDTNLYLQYLMMGHVANPGEIKGDNPFPLEFTVSGSQHGPCVVAVVKGISSEITTHAEASLAVQQSPRRFEGIYRKVQSKPIRKLIEYVLKERVLSEKSLLVADVKDKPKQILKEEEFKELTHLFIEGETPTIVETLEYFTKHPQHLKDPDYQVLLVNLLFRRKLLDQCLKEGHREMLVNFLEKNRIQFHALGEIQTTAFFLQLMRRLAVYCGDAALCKQSHETVRALARQSLYPEEMSVVEGEVIAHLGMKDTLSDEELKDLITLYADRQDDPVPDKWKDRLNECEVTHAIHKHAKAIQDYLVRDAERGYPFMNEFLKKLRGLDPVDWVMVQKEGEFVHFCTSDGKLFFFPLEGRLISLDRTESIPDEIRENPHFAALFPKTKKAVVKAPNLYAFKDAFGRETLVSMQGGQIIIEQEFSEGWHRFIPSKNFLYEESYKDGWHRIKNATAFYTKDAQNEMVYGPLIPPDDQLNDEKSKHSYLGSRYLVHHYNHWQSLEDPKRVILTSRSRGSLDYEVTLWNLSVEVRRLSSGDRLGKVSDFSAFVRFEDPSYIQQWYGPTGSLTKVELPRFGLTFTPESDQLYCDKFPGYYVCPNEVIPELGLYRHYLVIKNKAGKRKVLLPTQAFSVALKRESLMPFYPIDQALDSTKAQEYSVLKVERSGRLSAQSTLGYLHLAQILLLVQDYDKAGYYLKKYGNKLNNYTSKELTTLFYTQVMHILTGDSCGQAASIRMYAHFLVLRNCFLASGKVVKSDKNLEKNYLAYLSHYRKATACRLSEEEEIFVLTALLPEENDNNREVDGRILQRLQQLAPKGGPQLERLSQRLVSKKIVRANKTNTTLDALKIPDVKNTHPLSKLSQALYPQSNPWLENFKVLPRLFGFITDYLITRPYPLFEKHFHSLYELARGDDVQEKQVIKDAAAFLKTSSDRREVDMGLFFEMVLEQSDQFPDCPNRSEGFAAWNDWEKNIKSRASALLNEKQRLSENENPSRPYPDHTPENFSLEPPLPVFDPVQLAYTIPSRRSVADVTIEKQCFATPVIEPSPPPTPKAAEAPNVPPRVETLDEWLNTYNSDDPLVRKELDRLKADLVAYRQKPVQPIYQLSSEGQDDVRQILSEDVKENSEKLQALEKEILAIANRPSSHGLDYILHRMLEWGGARTPLSLDDVIVNFGLQDTQKLQQRNPALDSIDVNRLYAKVGEYLVLASHEQQRKRARKILDKITSEETCSPEEKEDLIQQLATLMLAKRCFDPVEHPPYLVFEYYGKLLMRADQVKDLALILSGEDPNPFLEKIMGSGKSTVMLPLIGLLRAKKDVLSLLIVPTQLFESLASDTQGILSDTFSHRLHALNFNRNTHFTVTSLSTILRNLEAIQKNRECLIMTSKSVQCLILKAVEKSSEYIRSCAAGHVKPMPDELILFRKILRLLSKQGYPHLEEADAILNVLHEVCFSLGAKLSPEDSDIRLISELYDILVNDPHIAALARWDSHPKPNGQASSLTEQSYRESILRILADRFVERMKTLTFENEAMTQKVRSFVEQLSAESRPDLIDYLCRNAKNAKAQALFDAQCAEVQDVLALASQEIASLLPHTLRRNWNEKYGVAEKTYSTPFSAAYTPNYGSIFSNPYVTMNYTFQTYLKIGIPKDILKKVIEALQQEALREQRDGGVDTPIQSTHAWVLFCKLRGDVDIPFFNYDDEQLNLLLKHINADEASRRKFVSEMVLPEMDLFESKLSCNPIQLFSFFMRISGFTGNLWNGASMHRRANLKPDQGIDAKTLDILWKRSRDAIHVMVEETTDKMLDELIARGPFDMICDAGGNFKDAGNKAIAEKIAKRLKQSVVYFDQRKKSVTDGAKTTSLKESNAPMDQRKTFLDQTNTRGANIPQKRRAVSLVTIGRNMLLNDLLQGVWRLRGLDRKQEVVFVLSKEVESLICQTVNKANDEKIIFDDILAFVIKNQAQQQGKDNWKAFKMELWNVPQQIMLDVLMSDKLTEAEIVEACQAMTKLWIKSANRRPRELYGIIAKERPSSEVVDEEAAKCKELLEGLFSQLPYLQQLGYTVEDCKTAVAEVVASKREKLPAMVTAKELEDDDEDDNTVEVELAAQTDMQTELEAQQHQETAKIKLGYIAPFSLMRHGSLTALLWDNLKTHPSQLPYFGLDVYMAQDPALHTYAEAFKGIDITLNVLKWPEENPTVRDLQLLGAHRTPLHFMAVKGEECVLVSKEEIKLFPFAREGWDLYNLTMGFCGEERALSPEIRKKLIQAMFLDGQSHFSKEEIAILDEWFSELGKDKMKTLFEKHILSGYPLKTDAYKESSLRRLFNTIS